MSFLSPAQFLWIFAAVVLVLCYGRWVNRQRVETATLPIWEQAFARRTWWSYWRRWASLLLLLVLLSIMVLALANPYLPFRALSGRNMVLIIDTSASMNATAGGKTPLAEACRAAHLIVAAMGQYDRISILSAGTAVKMECPSTGNQREIFAALRQIRPTDGVGGLVRALETAQQVLEHQVNASILVFSDHALDAPAAAKNITWQIVGVPVNNLGITHLAMRSSSPGAVGEQELFVEVGNFSEVSAACEVELRLPRNSHETTATIERISFELAPRSFQQRTVAVPIWDAGLLTASITAQDAFPADNVAELLVSPPVPFLNVRLVTDHRNSLTATALGSIPQIKLQIVENFSSPAAPGEVIVYEENVPSHLPAGPLLILGPSTDTDLWAVGKKLIEPVARQSSPLMNLDRVVIDEASELQLDRSYSGEVIASTAIGEPLAARFRRSTGDVFVLAFPPNQSDLPQRGEFPTLLLQALSLITSPRRHMELPATTQDEWVLSAMEQDREIKSPFGEFRSVPKGQPAAVMLQQQGVWEVTANDVAKDVLLVRPASILNAVESNLQFPAGSEKPKVPSKAAAKSSPLWTWLAALGIVVCLIDWILFHRRITE